MINIFIRSLDPTTTEAQLRDLFAAYWAVETVTLVKDRDTNGPRGLAFVEMTNAAEAKSAIESLNGFILKLRATHRESTGVTESERQARHLGHWCVG